MTYSTDSDRMVRLMLDADAPRNTSKCRDCSLYQATNDFHGSCKHKVVALAQDLSCYQADFAASATAAEEAGSYEIEVPTDFEEPEYTYAVTDETLDEMATETEPEVETMDLADLGDLINRFLKLCDRRDSDPEDRADIEAQKEKTLLSIKKQMINISVDMGLITITPEMYQKLYKKSI